MLVLLAFADCLLQSWALGNYTKPGFTCQGDLASGLGAISPFFSRLFSALFQVAFSRALRNYTEPESQCQATRNHILRAPLGLSKHPGVLSLSLLSGIILCYAMLDQFWNSAQPGLF
jgi:hypothetical protein